MKIRQAPPASVPSEPIAPLQLVCSSEDLLREVEHLQRRIREPVLSAQLRGPEGRRKEAVQQLAREAPLLHRECRPLFDKALRPLSDADREILAFMVTQMRQVEARAGDRAVERVSETVGQFLFDRFVAPKIDDPRTGASVVEVKENVNNTPEA